MKKMILPLALMLGITSVAQSAKPPAAKPPAAAPAEMQSGPIEGVITDDQGQDVIPYAGIVPPGSPAHKFGLIVAFHGRDGEEKELVDPISKALIANHLAGDYIVVGFKSKKEGWEDQDIDPVLKGIAWVEKEYPVDPRRIYGWGFSSGGFFIGKLAPQHPEIFTAAVVQSGGVGNPPKPDEGGQPSVQFYIVHGEKDERVLVSVAHESVAHLTAANYRFVYRELSGDEHGLRGPGAYPARRDAIRFLDSQRNRILPLTEAEQKTLAEITAKFKQPRGIPMASMYEPLSYLAGAETDAAMVLALQSQKSEIRLNAALLCDGRIYGDTVLAALPALTKDKDAKTRAAAIRGIGRAADFQRRDAIDALCTLAKDSSATVNDRIEAAGQLGVTLPLQFYCVNRDRPMVVALTDLLDDKSTQLKDLAQVSLDGKLTFDGQGYRVEK